MLDVGNSSERMGVFVINVVKNVVAENICGENYVIWKS